MSIYFSLCLYFYLYHLIPNIYFFNEALHGYLITKQKALTPC